MTPSEALALLQPAPVFRHPAVQPHPTIQPPPAHPASSLTRWADLGCGNGLFTLALASLLQPGSTVYAVDREPKIRPHLTPNQVSIEPIKTDFVKNALPFRDLDGILMANSLHYVKDKSTLVRNMRTANLHQQHVLLIIEYDTDRPTPIWVPYPISFTSLRDLFQPAGYSTIIQLADHPSIYHRSAIYSAYIA